MLKVAEEIPASIRKYTRMGHPKALLVILRVTKKRGSVPIRIQLQIDERRLFEISGELMREDHSIFPEN